MAKVSMFDEEKGYISGERYEVFRVASHGKYNGVYLFNEDTGRIFKVSKDDGKSPEASASEIREKSRKSKLINLILE